MANNPDHTDNIASLRRIEGQVRGVEKMIAERKYCIDILMQISAIKGALGSVESKILKKHFHNCVANTMKDGPEAEKEQKLDEIFKLIQRIKGA
jgi:CsoR family transcriptional regulator, copper-sensing transcriptional repressor